MDRHFITKCWLVVLKHRLMNLWYGNVLHVRIVLVLKIEMLLQKTEKIKIL